MTELDGCWSLAEYDEIWVIGTCLLAASSEDCEALPVLPVL
jgi:hypothetical protein